MTKNSIKRILVPIDGSKNSLRGLDQAISIARHCGAVLVGINVINVPPGIVLNRKKLESGSVKAVEMLMDAAKTKSARHGVQLNYKIIKGADPGYDIVQYSKKHKVDLIVIGARGLSKTRETFLGSVSNYVVHKSKIPVTIVK